MDDPATIPLMKVGRGQACLIAAFVPRQPDLIVVSVFWLSGLRSGSRQFCFDVGDEVVEHAKAGRCDEREAAIMARPEQEPAARGQCPSLPVYSVLKRLNNGGEVGRRVVHQNSLYPHAPTAPGEDVTRHDLVPGRQHGESRMGMISKPMDEG